MKKMELCHKKEEDKKLRYTQIPIECLNEITKCFNFGYDKYGEDNHWMNKGASWSSFMNASLRHLFAYWQGEDKDKESGLYHLTHSIVNNIILLYYELNGMEKDDRNNPPWWTKNGEKNGK